MRMVKKNQKRLMVMSVALFIICAMALGYAALSASLKINGIGTISTSWDILFTRIEEKSSRGVSSNQSEITDKLTATFDVDIEAPGNYIEYNVTLKNNGNIDAVIESIEGIVEANTKEPTGIQFKVSGIRIGDDLFAGDEKTFVVRAEIPSSETTLPSGTKTLELKVNVRQKDIDSSGLVTTFKDCFQTNEVGDTITKYLCGKENTNGYSEILDVTIPTEIDGITIRKIGRAAFQKMGITSIILPNTIVTIENDAFSWNQLTQVMIPSSVTKIDMGAFTNNQLPFEEAFIYNRNSDGTEDKTSLNSYAGAKRENIIVPEQIIMIGSSAFNGCQIKSITLPSHLQIIHSSAFFSNSLTDISFPETLTEIRENAFSTNKFTNLILPRNLIVLRSNAFTNNMLTSVEFRGAVPSDLGIHVFHNNMTLTANTIRVPGEMLTQYQTAGGISNGVVYSPAITWFGSDDTKMLDVFYE